VHDLQVAYDKRQSLKEAYNKGELDDELDALIARDLSYENYVVYRSIVRPYESGYKDRTDG